MNIFPDRIVLTISRLTALLREVIEDNFEQVWVEGEVSNFSSPSSGHLYFTLKDSSAQLRCVMFKSGAKNLKFTPGDGMALIARGRLSLYDQRGEYQLIVEYLEPAGIGALQLAYIQLKERLAKEGLFADSHKQALPPFPRTLGVVTSPTGAAIHDILNIIKRRFSSLEVLIFPVRVQGEGAAIEIAEAIDELNRLSLVDVMIVGRGGGSLEDLWAFNEEVVARAVYRSRIPVISAVGHETDWTICDFASDLRAPTPSAAAELVIRSTTELRATLEQLWHRLVLGIEHYLKQLRTEHNSLNRAITDPSTMVGHFAQRVDDLSSRYEQAIYRTIERNTAELQHYESIMTGHSPDKSIQRGRQTLINLSDKLDHLLTQHLEAAHSHFDVCTARLDVLSPLRTLARGYAIASKNDGTVVTDAASLVSGDSLTITLHKGKVLCTVC